jgi:hopanoid-associated phosphorylase
VHVFACGGDVRLRADAIRNAVRSGAPGIVSFGIAGGLHASLRTGDWVVATGVMSSARNIETDPDWSNRLAQRIPGAEMGRIVSVVDAVLEPRHKRNLHVDTGAAAVDMESFQAAELAEELGVPFAAVRVIADPTHRRIPPAARLGMQSDGTVAIRPILRSLLRKPSQLPLLLRVSSDATIAFRALLKGREQLGAHFASQPSPAPVASEPMISAEPERRRAEPVPA